jgi:hypothetical protein
LNRKIKINKTFATPKCNLLAPHPNQPHTAPLSRTTMFDISDVVNSAQDRTDDGLELISAVELRRRQREEATHGHAIPEFKKNSIICLGPKNPLRRGFILLVHNKWFDRFILATIMANCIFLAINDPICSKKTRSEVDAGAW